MSKFHINKHGVPAPCRATKGNCPLGGESGNENHFETQEEAQVAADEINAAQHGTLPGMVDNNQFSVSNLHQRFPELSDKEIQHLKTYVDMEEHSINEINELRAMEDKGTEEYFNRVQELRKHGLNKYAAHKNVPIDEEQLTDLVNDQIPQGSTNNDDPRFVFDEVHPEINEGRPMEATTEMMSAYSGKTKEQVGDEIRKLADEKSLSLHEANFEYWRNIERRTDKPLVYLDLETANPVNDKTIQYDDGQMTHIIEVGAIKEHPDGTTEEFTMMYDVPKEFGDRHGTGFSQFHNISPEMVAGKEQFSNEENQKKMMEFLDGSVISAHNSYFEEKQLTASLKGFGQKVKEGNVEMFCTRNFARFLVPEAEKHNNHKMVEAAGMEYVGGHRALNDTKMSKAAFDVLKDNR